MHFPVKSAPGGCFGLWAFVLLMTISPYAVADSRCDAYSQADRVTCLQGESAASEVELAQARNALVAAIGGWDENTRHRQIALSQLQAAEKAFNKYREAHCKLYQALGGGAAGNGLMMRRLMCWSQTNRTQAAHWTQAAQRLPQR